MGVNFTIRISALTNSVFRYIKNFSAMEHCWDSLNSQESGVWLWPGCSSKEEGSVLWGKFGLYFESIFSFSTEAESIQAYTTLFFINISASWIPSWKVDRKNWFGAGWSARRAKARTANTRWRSSTRSQLFFAIVFFLLIRFLSNC